MVTQTLHTVRSWAAVTGAGPACDRVPGHHLSYANCSQLMSILWMYFKVECVKGVSLQIYIMSLCICLVLLYSKMLEGLSWPCTKRTISKVWGQFLKHSSKRVKEWLEFCQNLPACQKPRALSDVWPKCPEIWQTLLSGSTRVLHGSLKTISFTLLHIKFLIWFGI